MNGLRHTPGCPTRPGTSQPVRLAAVIDLPSRRRRRSPCSRTVIVTAAAGRLSAGGRDPKASAYAPVMRRSRRRTPKWVDGSSRCAFRGKGKDEVDKLIAGPGV